MGKTSLLKALSRRSTASFGRLQFTPDLLPTDVIGVTVWDRSAAGSTPPRPLRADRARRRDQPNFPKTQSALLEAMGERQVTVDGVTYPLSPPFMVLATQNPIEHEGTYPLPESQLDRFLMRSHSAIRPARRSSRSSIDRATSTTWTSSLR